MVSYISTGKSSTKKEQININETISNPLYDLNNIFIEFTLKSIPKKVKN